MLRRSIQALFIMVTMIVLVTSLFLGPSKGAGNNVPSAAEPMAVKTQQPLAGTIDGSTTPERIPDQTAYTLMFRLLANRHTPEEQGRVRSYLRMMFGCSDCNNQVQEPKATSEHRIDAFLDVIKTFEQRVGRLDQEAKEIHERYGPTLSDNKVTARLNSLQKQKDIIVAEIVASLPSKIDAVGMEKIRKHISERVKKKIKVTPEDEHNIEPSRR